MDKLAESLETTAVIDISDNYGSFVAVLKGLTKY